MTPRQLVLEEAGKLEVTVSDREIEAMLWNETAFPFADETLLREQVREFLSLGKPWGRSDRMIEEMLEEE